MKGLIMLRDKAGILKMRNYMVVVYGCTWYSINGCVVNSEVLRSTNKASLTCKISRAGRSCRGYLELATPSPITTLHRHIPAQSTTKRLKRRRWARESIIQTWSFYLLLQKKEGQYTHVQSAASPLRACLLLDRQPTLWLILLVNLFRPLHKKN